jgi:DNA-binding NtrC family response regulator
MADVRDRASPLFRAPAPERVVTVLAISDCAEDQRWLSGVFQRTNWRLLHVRSIREATEVLKTNRVPVVLCESVLPDGNWKSLLGCFAQTSDEPLLVVTSRHADDRLWAEVLNLGGYDVLSKPFDHAEVVRVISAAWLQWRQRALAHVARSAAPEVVLRAAV